MDVWILVGIALGLSLDAFTVSVTSSTLIRELPLKHGLRMAAFFGAFQCLMPIVGWAAGKTFSASIQSFDHWIAFGLLLFVGGRMLWSAFPRSAAEEGSCSDEPGKDCRDLPTLVVLSIATSIDALAIGLSFAMLKVAIIGPSILIGLITFAVSFLGYGIGKRLGRALPFQLDAVGGLVLIGIGLKILLEHLLPS